jgi:hypothetical protein
VFRRIAQGGADLIHAKINPVIHPKVIAIAPQIALNFVSRDELTGAPGE